MTNKETAYRKMAITSGSVSCGVCNKGVPLSECKEKEEKLDNEFYKYRLTLVHSCGCVVVGVDV